MNETWPSNRAQQLGSPINNYYIYPGYEYIDRSNETQYCIFGIPLEWYDKMLGLKQMMTGSEYSTIYPINSANWNTSSPSDNVLKDWLGINTPLEFKNPSNFANITNSSGGTFDVWLEKGPERAMNNIAAVLTQLGLDPDLNVNGTDVVYGQTGQVVNLVRVRWLWLILPYGLCLAGILFLLLTAYLSRQAGAPLWKSSINALFYHGIDYDHGAFEPLTTIAEMGEQASRTTAVLRSSGITGKLMLETTVTRRQLSQDDEDEEVTELRERGK